jgi:hypothetical protein
MPLWEWILIAASLAIPVTAVAVAATLTRDPQCIPGAGPRVRLRVPSFANAPHVAQDPEVAYAA